jgi:hypothetical protein
MIDEGSTQKPTRVRDLAGLFFPETSYAWACPSLMTQRSLLQDADLTPLTAGSDKRVCNMRYQVEGVPNQSDTGQSNSALDQRFYP